MARKKIEEMFVPVNYGTNVSAFNTANGDVKTGHYSGSLLFFLRGIFPKCRILDGSYGKNDECRAVIYLQHIQTSAQIRIEFMSDTYFAMYLSDEGFVGRRVKASIKRDTLNL